MAKPYITEECLESFFNLFEENTFSDDEKALLNQNRTELVFKKTEIISKQGSLATQLIFIQKGLTKSYFEYGSTKQMICVHPAHSLLGIQGLSFSKIYHCTLAALEEVTVCMFDIKTFMEVSKKNASFVFQLLNINIEMQSTSIDRIFSLKLKSDESKLADILLCLSQRVYRSDNFNFSFSLEEVANLTGTPLKATETIWKNFQEDKLLSFEKGQIHILDKEELLTISAKT
jgi:CRP/FNR family transcriptional regulator